MSVNARRRGRVVAFQALYEHDTSSHDAIGALERIDEEALTDDARAFARHLIERVTAKQDEIDAKIAAAAPAYPVDQLSPIDRNILRLAIAEMLGDNGTPVKVAINEAIELAKSYGSAKSARFINGALGYVAREREQQEADQPTIRRG
jgi:transcription antitermination protein NusB